LGLDYGLFRGPTSTFIFRWREWRRFLSLYADNEENGFMIQLPSRKTMEQAYLESDVAFDGLFFVAVKTTGIFCRPTCGARKPLPGNVEFYPTPREALYSGYRPCKRCQPLNAIGSQPEWVEKLLKAVESDSSRKLRDADIRSLGIDPARARRFFKTNHGMTFQAYSRARRLGKAFEQIRKGEDLDDIALGNG
jgi:AraC family transcriptional regulator of adaptative response/methylated-DNA-[protein]-cysteine methyltransferase